jgi:oligopeptide/dipeptide ABC transporter ATP-binding protein
VKDCLLEVEDLVVEFNVGGRYLRAINGVSFQVKKGEKLGIVGESGSGKSVTSLSVMRLIPEPPGKISEGRILFQGKNLLELPWEEMRRYRGNEISMIFQEPMTSLNPVFTIGMQVREVIELHKKVSRQESFDLAVQALESVGIPDAPERMKAYPHQFSGGMRQRVMIAMALACQPSLLIADEPTTALDVTVQAQILDLMAGLKDKNSDSAVMLITHDLAVVAQFCDRVIVMYGGMVQEEADVYTLFEKASHPYTQGLMRSIPNPDAEKKEELYAIAGMVPALMDMPQGCRFCTRCQEATKRCEQEVPALHDLGQGHKVRCHLVEDGAFS